jgi:hypothetical protein
MRYYQLKVEEKDRPKTAFTTPIGQFEFTRMPFGLTNAPKAFQRVMVDMLKDFKNVKVCLDDIVIFNKTAEEHKENVLGILRYLNEQKISINYKKCEFFKNEISYLGLLVNRESF